MRIRFLGLFFLIFLLQISQTNRWRNLQSLFRKALFLWASRRYLRW